MELLLRELRELAVDFGGVFLVELVMLCVLMVVGLYVMYTDLRFRDVPPVAVWTLLGATVATVCIAAVSSQCPEGPPNGG